MTTKIEEYLDGNGRSPFGEWFDDLPATAAAKVPVAKDCKARRRKGEE